MLASVQHHDLNITVSPGFTWDEKQRIFRGEVLYGDEILTLCVTKERMQRSIHALFEADQDIEPLFHPTEWISAAEHPYDKEVYFAEEAELGPDTV